VISYTAQSLNPRGNLPRISVVVRVGRDAVDTRKLWPLPVIKFRAFRPCPVTITTELSLLIPYFSLPCFISRFYDDDKINNNIAKIYVNIFKTGFMFSVRL
jgi:hypothetical protein